MKRATATAAALPGASGAKAARVVVADRHAVTRALLRDALEAGGLVVCEACADVPATLSAVVRLRPDVCLLDVDLPGGGIAAARAVASRLRHPKVVMLARVVRDEDMFAALQAGVDGFLAKDLAAGELVREVMAVVGGAAALSPRSTSRLVAEYRSLARRASRRRTASADAAGVAPDPPREQSVSARSDAGGGRCDVKEEEISR